MNMNGFVSEPHFGLLISRPSYIAQKRFRILEPNIGFTSNLSFCIVKSSIKNDLTEVRQSTISKRLIFYCLLLSKPLNELTITDRQANRKDTYRGTSLGSAQKITNMDLRGALKSALQGPF